ncbi:hypothetical protein RJZ56_002624 [Blastomyces dermatitidis]
MSQKRRPRRLRTHAAGSKTIIGAKQPADSSPHDSQTPSKYLKVTKSMSRYSLQQTGECGLAVNDRTSGEEWEWSELVDESEWKEYEEIAASPTSEEKELGNRAMIKLDLFADIEWSKNARPIRTRRTEPDDGGGAGPSGSRRQSQEPPTRQTEQSSAEQHGSSCQDIHSMPGEPGEASQNSQPGVEGSSAREEKRGSVSGRWSAKTTARGDVVSADSSYASKCAAASGVSIPSWKTNPALMVGNDGPRGTTPAANEAAPAAGPGENVPIPLKGLLVGGLSG